MLRAQSDIGQLLEVGGTWVSRVEVCDTNGYLVDDALVAAVTDPDGAVSTVDVEHMEVGRYRVAVVLPVAGRFLLNVSGTDGVMLDFGAYARGPVSNDGLPTVDDVASFLRSSAASYTTQQLQRELDSETSAQRARCYTEPFYPPDLRKALLRRVQRALAMNGLPLAVNVGDADTGPTFLPGRDPEVRRLEAPYRRVALG